MLVVAVVLVGLAAQLLVACDSGQPTEPDSATPHPTTSTLSASATPGASYVDVEFSAADGNLRPGRLFGDGNVGVVLSHMGRSGDGPEDWQTFAEILADRGFLVLTYQERRAVYGDIWYDVLGAVEYLRSRGAETVIAGGASIGAMASLQAATQPDSGIHAVVWLAGVLNNSGYAFTKQNVSVLQCPMLIASSDDDTYGAGPDARTLHRWTSDVSELVIVSSNRHGTDILTGDNHAAADKLRDSMTRFIEKVREMPKLPCTTG